MYNGTATSPVTVTLEPPGAGMRWYERLVAKYVVARYMSRWSDDDALRVFRREGEEVLVLTRGLTQEQLRERVLVPRMRGLEDSSRYWSVAMTLEHLEIVNLAVAETIVQLAAGQVPPGKLAIADVKPHASVDPNQVVAAYAACLDRFETRVAERVRPMNPAMQYSHPWFGPIDAHGWLCFAPLHQSIHHQQIKAILAGRGRPGPRVVETPRQHG